MKKIKEIREFVDKYSNELWEYAHVEDHQEGISSLSIEMGRSILKEISDKLKAIEEDNERE